MNNLIDEQTLADYLKRESEFSRRYQAIDTDEVPAELDQAILLQAAQAASTNTSISKKVVELDRLRKWRRLTLPFAMAATLVLSVSILMHTGDHTTTHIPITSASKLNEPDSSGVEVELSDSRAPRVQTPNTEIVMPVESTPANSPVSASPKMDAPPASPELKRRVDASPATNATDKMEQPIQAATSGAVAVQSTLSEATPTAPASLAAVNASPTQPNKSAATNQTAMRSQSDAASLEEIVTTGVRVERKPPSYGPHGTSTSISSRQDASADEYEKELRESNPSAWLDYIRELRNANKSFKANREWKHFVKMYPNYEVAADDIARGKK